LTIRVEKKTMAEAKEWKSTSSSHKSVGLIMICGHRRLSKDFCLVQSISRMADKYCNQQKA